MGYRLRLGRFPKDIWETYVKDKDYTQVVKYLETMSCVDENWSDEHYKPLYIPPKYEQLYEIGKYVDYKEGRTPFYSFELGEDEFEIMSKEGLKVIIEDYHNSVKEFYTKRFNSLGGKEAMDINLLKILRDKRKKYYPLDKHAFHDILCDQYAMLNEWDSKWTIPYYLDEPEKEKDGAIVRSWKMEYAIFNLVYIYQTFDWENDLLIYSGW